MLKVPFGYAVPLDVILNRESNSVFIIWKPSFKLHIFQSTFLSRCFTKHWHHFCTYVHCFLPSCCSFDSLTLIFNPIQYRILSANVAGYIIQMNDYCALGGNGHWRNPSGKITIVRTRVAHGWSDWALHSNLQYRCIIPSAMCTL